MAKHNAKRKLPGGPDKSSFKKAKSNATFVKSSLDQPIPKVDEIKSLHSIGLTDDDVEIAIDTLRTLSENPSVIKSKACKDLRTSVYDFRQASTTGLSASGDTNLTARISGSLADGAYTQARILLAEMRIRGKPPKLGALCRWVRDLDVVSGLAEQLDGSSKRTSLEEDLLVVLDSILRLTGPIDYTVGENFAGPISPRAEWDLRGVAPRRQIYERVLSGTISTELPPDTRPKFRMIETIPGAQRKPPNLHPAILYTSTDDAIPLQHDNPPNTSHHTHPVVPNLHLIKDVLTPEECTQIIAAAESIGFTPDAPIRAAGEESSILAHNFYWVIDSAFCSKLWSRVEPFVPKMSGGKKVRGLNRRFRVYRYVPGAEYRAHIDGAWPPSGIGPEDKYIYDASPPEAKQSSLLTFLIYLNDEFEAGETTFFLPSAREGVMNAYPIKPIQGSVAMFPHGETQGSLLHEGTGVRKAAKASAKYVIRTDVLYDVDIYNQ